MDIKKTLQEAGLSEGETKVYLALLKLGSTTVHNIKQETAIHRTTIYDFLEKLINKALVNYVVKNNVKHYKATHPNKLLDFIKEKEENIKEILPDLKELAELKKEEIKVETYLGREGLKTILNDMIRTKKDMCSFGIDESMWKERFPILIEQYFKREEEVGMKERLLTKENAKFTYKHKKTTNYRAIPEKYFNPTPTFIYGDTVVTIIWEPLTLIKIENSELAESYRKHFELLWKGAKKI